MNHKTKQILIETLYLVIGILCILIGTALLGMMENSFSPVNH